MAASLDTNWDEALFDLFEEDDDVAELTSDGDAVAEASLRSVAVSVQAPNVAGRIEQESIVAFALSASGAIEPEGAVGYDRRGIQLPGVQVTGTILFTGTLRPGLMGLPGVRVTGAILPEEQQIDLPGLQVSGTILAGSVGDGSRVQIAVQGDGEILAETSDLESREILLPGVRVSGAIVPGSAAGTSTIAIALDVSGQIIAGGIMSGVILLPGVGISAAGGATGEITSGLIEIPLTVTGTILTPSLISASGDAFALNTKTGGLTRYTNFPFNSMVTYQGRTFAAGPGGLSEITGTTDNTRVEDETIEAPIAASMTTGHLSLGSAKHKRIASVFIGYRSSGALRMYLRFDDNADTLYMLHETRASGIYRNRLKTGRGAKGSYIQATIENDNGADFEIDSLEVEVETLRRRA